MPNWIRAQHGQVPLSLQHLLPSQQGAKRRKKKNTHRNQSNDCMIRTAGKAYLARIGDNNILNRFIILSLGHILNSRNNIHTLKHSSENDMFTIEPAGDGSADEELGTVGVFARVGHGESAGAGVAQFAEKSGAV